MAFQPNRPLGYRPVRGQFRPRMPFIRNNSPRGMNAMQARPFMGARPFFGGDFNNLAPRGRFPRPRGLQPGYNMPRMNSRPLRPDASRNTVQKFDSDNGKMKSESEAKQIKTENKQQNEVDVHDFAVKTERADPNEQPVKAANIVLDSYNMDLHFNTDDSGLTGWTLHKDGFEYLWGGARANYGVKQGKVAYECVVDEALPVVMPPTERNPHVLRVGFSTDCSDLQLGEDKLSYGYGGTGKISTNSKFSDYGLPFSVGDVITCYLDLESRPKTINYMVNGRFLGVAFKIGQELGEKALYPHVTCKNMKFTLNFGVQWPKYPITNGFSMLQYAQASSLVKAPDGPATRSDAEIIMMVGLPACGKTCWAEKYCKEHPEKKYYMLGTNNIIDKMRIIGLTRKGNYHGRWDALIKQATECLNVWLKIAEKRVRNYILDQTNVYFTARRRKMRNFAGYKRIACVIVNNSQVLAERTAKREKEEGKFVPVEAVMEMKANFSLPEVGESFGEVRYIEEKPPQALSIVNAFREECKEFKRAPKRPAEQESNANTKTARTDLKNEKDTVAQPYGDSRSPRQSQAQHSCPGLGGARQPYQVRAGRGQPYGEQVEQPYGEHRRPQLAYGEREGRQSYRERAGEQQTYEKRDRGRQPYGDREGGGQPYRDREGGGQPYGDREGGRQPYGDREGGGQPYRDRAGGQQAKEERDRGRQPYGDREGGGQPYRDREGGGQPYGDREGGRQPYGDREGGGQPYRDRAGGQQAKEERDRGRQPYGDRDGVGQPYRDRSGGHQANEERDRGRQPHGEREGDPQYHGDGGRRPPYRDREDLQQPYRDDKASMENYHERKEAVPYFGRDGPHRNTNEATRSYTAKEQDKSYYRENIGTNQSYQRAESHDVRYGHGEYSSEYRAGNSISKEEQIGNNRGGITERGSSYTRAGQLDRVPNYEHHSGKQTYQSTESEYSRRRDMGYERGLFDQSSPCRDSIKQEAPDIQQGVRQGPYSERRRFDDSQYQSANEPSSSNWSQFGYGTDSRTQRIDETLRTGRYFETAIKQEPIDDDRLSNYTYSHPQSNQRAGYADYGPSSQQSSASSWQAPRENRESHNYGRQYYTALPQNASTAPQGDEHKFVPQRDNNLRLRQASAASYTSESYRAETENSRIPPQKQWYE